MDSGLLPRFIYIQPPLTDRVLKGFQHELHAEPAAMAEAVDQGFLHPVDLQADQTGTQLEHLQALLPQAF